MQGVGEDGYAVGEEPTGYFDEGEKEVKKEGDFDIAGGAVYMGMMMVSMIMYMVMDTIAVMIMVLVIVVLMAMRHADFSCRKVSINPV
jgi:uncharacterized membrane protein